MIRFAFAMLAPLLPAAIRLGGPPRQSERTRQADGVSDTTPPFSSKSRAQDGHPDDYVFLPDFTKSRNVGFALKKDEPRLRRRSTRRCWTWKLPVKPKKSLLPCSTRDRPNRCSGNSKSEPITKGRYARSAAKRLRSASEQ
jgi:hypothetical protein